MQPRITVEELPNNCTEAPTQMLSTCTVTAIPPIKSLNVNVTEPCAITAHITAAESLMTVLQTTCAGGTASGGDSRGAISADVNPGTASTLMLSILTQVTGVMLRRCFSAGLFSCGTLMTTLRRIQWSSSAEANAQNDSLNQPCVSDSCTWSFSNVINHALAIGPGMNFCGLGGIR